MMFHILNIFQTRLKTNLLKLIPTKILKKNGKSYKIGYKRIALIILNIV